MNTLLKNGKFWKGNSDFCNSVVFDSESGLIGFAGNLADLRKNYDEEIDLKGKVVIPAFTDGHCHLMKGAMVKTEIDLRDASTRNEFIAAISEYKNKLKEGEWIEGGYFSETNFTEDFKVDRNFLDSVCEDVPIVISRIDLHSAVSNSLAFRLSGIESKKDVFNNDEIISDSKGSMTGEITERARYYMLDCIPVKPVERKKAILKEQINYLHSLGITSVTDITWDGDLEVYEKMIDSCELNLRINSVLQFEKLHDFDSITEYLRASPDNRVSAENINPLVKFGAFKAFYDGALSSESGLFIDNYRGRNHKGVRSEFVSSGDFERVGIEIDNKGFQILVHAIGDLAVRETLDFADKLNSINGARDRRFRIEHAQHIHPSDFERFRNLNIITSVQPSHLYVDAVNAAQKVYEPSNTHNYKFLIDEGCIVCFGTDFPVASENPFETIYCAMTRIAKGFYEGFHPENSLDLITCLDAYTAKNAYAEFGEDNRGKIQKGMAADLVVLDRDIFSCSTEEIKNTNTEMTFFAGTRVY